LQQTLTISDAVQFASSFTIINNSTLAIANSDPSYSSLLMGVYVFMISSTGYSQLTFLQGAVSSSTGQLPIYASADPSPQIVVGSGNSSYHCKCTKRLVQYLHNTLDFLLTCIYI
jgi:hypothetical protein